MKYHELNVVIGTEVNVHSNQKTKPIPLNPPSQVGGLYESHLPVVARNIVQRRARQEDLEFQETVGIAINDDMTFIFGKTAAIFGSKDKQQLAGNLAMDLEYMAGYLPTVQTPKLPLIVTKLALV